MSLYTINRKEKLPPLSVPVGLTIEECTDIGLLASLGNVSFDNIIARLANDHAAYVAYINKVPAAFGWVAKGKALIGELNHEIILPLYHRYLWNFRTVEAFRGLGIYPVLLQYIIRMESLKADAFWIIHAPENKSSLSGIKKAGFHYAGKLFIENGRATIENNPVTIEFVEILTEMGIPVSETKPASCWNCSSPYLKKRKQECCCETAGSLCVGKEESLFVV